MISEAEVELVQETLHESGFDVPEKVCREIVENIDLHKSNMADLDMYKTGWTPGAKCEKEKRIEELEKALRKEENLVRCADCSGYGYFYSGGGTFTSKHSCNKCNGKGRR